MEIRGTIVNILPVESGVSKNTGNEWKRQTVILTTESQYPKSVAITLANALIGTVAVGETLDISINIESREYDRKWYTSVNGWKVNRLQAQPYLPAYRNVYPQTQSPYPTPQQQRAPATAPYIAPSATGFEPQEGDLPY